MIGPKLSGFLLLALLLTVPVTSQARAYYNNPFGVYVNGWVMDYQTNCSVPCQQIYYNQGDYGSGTLTPSADASTSVLGAYSRSYASVPGNQLLLTANSDVPVHLTVPSKLRWHPPRCACGTPSRSRAQLLVNSAHSRSQQTS